MTMGAQSDHVAGLAPRKSLGVRIFQKRERHQGKQQHALHSMERGGLARGHTICHLFRLGPQDAGIVFIRSRMGHEKTRPSANERLRPRSKRLDGGLTMKALARKLRVSHGAYKR